MPQSGGGGGPGGANISIKTTGSKSIARFLRNMPASSVARRTGKPKSSYMLTGGPARTGYYSSIKRK